MSIERTLEERNKSYGSYKKGSIFRAKVMSLIRERYRDENGPELEGLHETMLWDLVNKLSRLAVSPDHIDSIHDIAGYASLYEKVLLERNDNA